MNCNGLFDSDLSQYEYQMSKKDCMAHKTHISIIKASSDKKTRYEYWIPNLDYKWARRLLHIGLRKIEIVITQKKKKDNS